MSLRNAELGPVFAPLLFLTSPGKGSLSTLSPTRLGKRGRAPLPVYPGKRAALCFFMAALTARTDGPSAWLSIHPSWSTSHGHDFCGWRLTSRQPSAVQLKCSIALAAMEVSVYQCISHLRAARGQFSEASAALFPTHCAFQQSAHRPSVRHNRQLGQSGAFLASSK